MAITAAAITGGLGLLGSGLSANAGKSAASDAAKASEQQAAAQMANLNYQKQMAKWAMGYADPSLRRLSAEAKSDQPLDYGLMAAQIRRNYANQARNLTGLGYGRMAGMGSAMRGLQLGQASDLSQAFAEGLSKKRGLQQWLGGTMGGAAMGQAGNVGQAYGGLGNVYGQQAQQAYGAAQQGWQGAYQGILGAAQGLGSYFANRQPPPAADSGYIAPSQLPAAQYWGQPPTPPGQIPVITPQYSINNLPQPTPYSWTKPVGS